MEEGICTVDSASRMGWISIVLSGSVLAVVQFCSVSIKQAIACYILSFRLQYDMSSCNTEERYGHKILILF